MKPLSHGFRLNFRRTNPKVNFSKPFASTASRPTSFRPIKLPRAKVKSAYGVSYTVSCPICNKKFKRDRYDTKLNEHKDKYGNRCFGRIGYIV
jgi:hypothetical protein